MISSDEIDSISSVDDDERILRSPLHLLSIAFPATTPVETWPALDFLYVLAIGAKDNARILKKPDPMKRLQISKQNENCFIVLMSVAALLFKIGFRKFSVLVV